MVNHIQKLFDRTYLRWFDIVDKGDIPVVIEDVYGTEVYCRRKKALVKRPVVKFVKGSKPLVLNVTNALSIESIAKTYDFEKWKGVQVVLYVDHNVKNGNETVNGIRIKAPTKQ